MKRRWIWVIPILAAACPPLSHAESIWDRRDRRAASLFEDNRARQVGDLLTVAISENTNTNEREQRAMDKRTNFSGGLTFAGTSSSGNTNREGNLNFNLSGNSRRGFNGSDQFTSDRRFIDRMAVTVVDILPNGNMIVEGSRTRIIAGEERTIRMTGIVRPADIGTNNTVQSQFIAQFKISYLGRGPESAFVNQGYWSRALNLLWPF